MSDMFITGEALLSYLEPLPMDWLIIHDAASVRAWHSTDRDQLLAVAHQDLQLHVAHRDLHVARRNVADLTGGVRAILDDPQH